MTNTLPAAAMDQVLKGLRVIDLTQNVAGPYCTQILGDMGAEIIKVERPGRGDDTRGWTPPSWAEQSPTYLAFNRNKKSLCIDLDAPEGQRIIARLAQHADILVHSMKPGSAEARGLGFETLRANNRRLVYAAISAFGKSGPLSGLPGYDPLMQAFTGIMSVTGSEGQAPVRVSVSLIDMGTGMWAAMGILAALRELERTGQGSCVDTSLLETGVSWMSVFVANYRASGVLPKKLGSAMTMMTPYELFPADDGWAFIAAGNDRMFAQVCKALEIADAATDPRFAKNAARVKHRAELRERIEQATTKLSAAEIVRRLRACGAPCSVLNDVGQMLQDEQVASTGIVQPLSVSEGDDHKVIGLPFTLDGHRTAKHRAPPALGAHTRELLLDAGYDPAAIGRMLEQGLIG
jgi:crotonobetainyl-CoA:carnitine CoA-transferase CaiB-like acyl-CoA transferase